MRASWSFGWGQVVVFASLLTSAMACIKGGDGAPSGSGWSSLVDSAFADSTANAARLDSTWLDPSPPPALVLALPDSVRDFEMAAPSSLAIRRGGACLIAVTDYYETSVHFFSSPSRYQGTRFLGSRRREALSGVGHASIGKDGTLYLNELGRRRAVAVSKGQDGVRVFQSPSVTVSMPHAATLEPVSPNRLIENWMTPSIPVASGSWAQEDLPLLRVIDSLGNYLGGVWRITDRPGHLLTHGLNQGFLARVGDTLWFAYAVSGEVIRGVLDTTHTPWAIANMSRMTLPRLYTPVPPQWYRSATDSIGALTVDQQLSGMAVTDDGRLIVGQTISYPPRDEEGSIHQPTSAVVIYDREGRPLRGWRAGGRIRDIATGGGILGVIVEASGDLQVLVYRLSDVVPGLSASGPCAEEV